ncbi:MAG: Gfo/Idh/MocA family oxidoreductase [Lachnospiraceae bacterium]|nr:Gfo/Idh/MocA family oxidoreductase [Lachnospiraceae bacterium]
MAKIDRKMLPMAAEGEVRMKQVTAILIGAGNRGAEAYASYALKYPGELSFVGVAEPREDRRREFALKHGIEDRYAVSDWKELLAFPRLADCVLICTQDQLHVEPMRRAMESGYDILCEKPVSPIKEELIELKKETAAYPGLISVSHVLRYSPFFRKIKEIIDSKVLGELVNIQHMESVGFWHMAHSFVRGNWSNRKESCPMILAKCCHDFDILLYLTGRKCKRLSSFGRLTHFKSENAPVGAPKRCTDGCPHKESCPFFAPRFYEEHPQAETGGFRKIVTMGESREDLLKALQTGPYGRCVYHCDNDVVDHQVVNMEFEGGLTVSLTMCAFTNLCERTITIQGTRGELTGRMEDDSIQVVDFLTGNRNVWKLNTPRTGHSGSDEAMMRELVGLISSGRQSESVSKALEAIESHLIAFAAEESQLAGGKVIEL